MRYVKIQLINPKKMEVKEEHLTPLPLASLSPSDILAREDREIERLIVQAQNERKNLSLSEIEESMRGRAFVPGFGSVFLGGSEKMVAVIKREAQRYQELDRTARAEGLGPIDYDWLNKQVEELDQTLPDAITPIILSNGLTASRKVYNSTTICPFPVEDYVDYFVWDSQNPWKNIRLSRYTLNLIKQLRFPEGIAAPDYRLSIARFIWVMGIGPQELQTQALEADWNETEEYLKQLTGELKSAPKIKIQGDGPDSIFGQRKSQEISIIVDYMIRNFPLVTAKQIIPELDKIRVLLDELPKDSGGAKSLWPDWAEELQSVFTFIIPYILEEREDLSQTFGPYVREE